MGTEKSPDPFDRLGVYKRLADVPEAERLRTYRDQYTDRDVWQAYVAARSPSFDSASYRATLRKTERTWRTHMADRDRHPALARPRDVESWCCELVRTRTRKTVYSEYWVRLEEFYRWLRDHTAHPHTYSPVLMAAANYETAGTIWAEKLDWDPRDNNNE